MLGQNVAINNLEQYKLNRNPKPYMIDDYQSIGWPDPFPKKIPTIKDNHFNLRSHSIKDVD